MATTQSLLEFEGFYVSNFALASNEDFDDQPPRPAAVDVDYEVTQKQDDPTRYMVSMVIAIGETAGLIDAGQPYRLRLQCAGFYRFPPEFDEEKRSTFVKLNCAAMLYGVARGYVSQVTANALNGTYLLPAFNFVELRRIKDEAEQQSRLGAAETLEGSDATPE